jgi:hypothetical protein
MMGTAVNRDKPDSAQARCSAPLEIVGWDIFGPCKSALLVGTSIVQSSLITFLGTVGFTCSKIRVRCLKS